MHVYLSPWAVTVVGDGSFDGPELAAHTDDVAYIDLRPDVLVAQGWTIAATSQFIDTSDGASIYLGELDEPLRIQVTRAIENRLGLARDVLKDETTRNLVVALLTRLARADRWKPLQDTRIYLLNELIWEEGV